MCSSHLFILSPLDPKSLAKCRYDSILASRSGWRGPTRSPVFRPSERPPISPLRESESRELLPFQMEVYMSYSRPIALSFVVCQHWRVYLDRARGELVSGSVTMSRSQR